MTAFAHATSSGVARPYASSRRALRLTMIATYPFFFAATLTRRLNPFASQTIPSRSSIFSETRSRAAAIVPFIFMG